MSNFAETSFRLILLNLWYAIFEAIRESNENFLTLLYYKNLYATEKPWTQALIDSKKSYLKVEHDTNNNIPDRKRLIRGPRKLFYKILAIKVHHGELKD